MIMNYFYLTFDMSPKEEFGKDYITMGVGARNQNPPESEDYESDNTIVYPSIKNDTKPVEPIKPDPPTPVPTPEHNDTTPTTNCTGNATTDAANCTNTTSNTTKPHNPPIIRPETTDDRTFWERN